MPTRCDISFDSPSGVYYGGQTLSGHVNLVTETEKTIRAIHIEITGYAKVRWTENRTKKENGKTKHYTVTYTAHEQYLASRTYVLGFQGGPHRTLNPGRYTYNFSCLLPLQLPTSFNGEYGHIKYEVVVTIDRPLRFDNVFSQGFTVICPLDLNLDPRYKTPTYTQESKEFCCCCCASDPLEAKLSLPIVGFVNGQEVKFKLLVKNESNVDIEKCVVSLNQRVIFKSTTPSQKTKISVIVLGKQYFGGVLKLSSKEYAGGIILPTVPPTSTEGCQCIKIIYYIAAKIVPNRCYNKNLNIDMGITVGTVPVLIQTPSQPTTNNVIISQPGFSNNIPTAPELPLSPTSDLPPSYNSLLPPSYQEVIKGENFEDPDEIPHKAGPFAPKYPVYDGFSPSAPPLPPQNE